MKCSLKAEIGLDLRRKDFCMISATYCLNEIGQDLNNETEHTVSQPNSTPIE